MKKSVPRGKPPRIQDKIPAWQTGAFARHAEFRFILPEPFLMICRLADVTPERVLRDFIGHLSFGWHARDCDKPRAHLADYFLAQGYGADRYDEAQIRRIFRELEAVGLVFPGTDEDSLIDLYAAWRERHYRCWFEQWQKKRWAGPAQKERL